MWRKTTQVRTDRAVRSSFLRTGIVRRSAVTGAVLAAAAAAPMWVSPAEPMALSAQQTVDHQHSALSNDIDQSQARKELGLPDDPATIRTLLQALHSRDPAVVVDGGVVMSRNERAGMIDLDRDAAVLGKQIRSRFGSSPTFGGMYIDRPSGHVVVRTVGAATRLRSWISAFDSDRDRLATATFSYRALQGVARDILLADRAASDSGAHVVATSVSERDNMVLVSLDSISTQRQGAIASHYPAGMISFTKPAELVPTGVNRLDAPPLAGGQRITRLAEEVGFLTLCTSAFVGFNNLSGAGVLGDIRRYYLITAGHCGGDDTHPWSQSGDDPALGAYPIGSPDRNSYSGTTPADAQRIPIRPSDASFLVRISTTQSNIMSSQQSETADVVGERVCMSGATSEERERCGTLYSRDFSGGVEGGPTMVRLREASWFSLGGDSGGSVYDLTVAKGVVFGNVTYGAGTTSEVRHGLYSHIGEVLRAVDVSSVH